tara:strand:+ start:91 stop:423 length:333 start_codon:yes stop_codon:yes gene_type:complete
MYLEKYLILLIIIIILCILFTNQYENFNRPHNCSKDSTILNPLASHKSLSKGWCGKVQPYSYSDIFNFNNMDDTLDEDYSESRKCHDGFNRMKAKDSINYDSKGWCKKNK